MFVDEARVFVAGGRGGNGAATFHREKYRSMGGPDGGDGGRGGSVVFEADPNVGSLAHLRDHPHKKAPSGSPGARNNRSGAAGGHLVIKVPLGTVVRDETGDVLADLASPGDSMVAAKGGRGGKGNASFMTGQRRAPTFAELGEPGEEQSLRLDLRLIADVAVIGYPNVGKSTLVGAISRARPKVADYPFTTLEPSLGVVEVGERRFTVCDIPGLIEGASEGKGLGLKFLRHAERATVFVHLIDASSERDPIDDYRKVRGELTKFRQELETRPELVAVNKVDAVDSKTAHNLAETFRDEGIEPVLISAKRGDGLDRLVELLSSAVGEARAVASTPGYRLYKTEPSRILVEKEREAWRVRGQAVERWVAMTDMSNTEAVSHLQARLEKAGVERVLAQAGADHGDEVRIGEIVFEWWPSGSEPREKRRRTKSERITGRGGDPEGPDE